MIVWYFFQVFTRYAGDIQVYDLHTHILFLGELHPFEYQITGLKTEISSVTVYPRKSMVCNLPYHIINIYFSYVLRL